MECDGSVQVISKELIKPSSSTPHHLRNIKLSLLDQLSPPIYMPAIFFYEADELRGLTSSTNRSQLCRNLKQSLSNTLTLFYPIAGKIDREKFTVYCDDTGVEFIEARSNARLHDIIQEPGLDRFQKYLPVGIHEGIHIGEAGTLLMVQINFFECGGVAIGVCMSHLVADSSSLFEFMNAWAATCRGETPKSVPEFGVMARYFPARDLSYLNISPSSLMGDDKLVTKRFVFDKEKLAALKQAATGSDIMKDPTRVEAVSAFILKCFIENNFVDAKKGLFAAHMVNIRSRASISLENAFGMGCFYGAVEIGHRDRAVPKLHELASKVRRAIRTIDYEYIRETEREDRYLSDLGKLFMLQEGEADAFVFSSLCRYPMYEVEFGWGKPVLAWITSLQMKHLVILMSTRDGDGIEAWINLLPDQAQSLEEQFKLIAGKIDPLNVAVYCDDTSVEFIKARANARQPDVVQESELDQFQKYLSVELLEGIHNGEGTYLMVQINFFACGGVASGVYMSRLVADASSLFEFMNAWAATCRRTSRCPSS
ncbi:Stemmadenine O-acetyltransferase [Sesamum alatum]|uniref:Stemmadenine O-acetyltransferase n=1 Tax=Sesamum alatum TaxID=300844 RepID=A0AAE2C9Q6_9LAMI|nr:Stemmadenine O-acetyltransferase [Sesamum alatum]